MQHGEVWWRREIGDAEAVDAVLRWYEVASAYLQGNVFEASADPRWWPSAGSDDGYPYSQWANDVAPVAFYALRCGLSAERFFELERSIRYVRDSVVVDLDQPLPSETELWETLMRCRNQVELLEFLGGADESQHEWSVVASLTKLATLHAGESRTHGSDYWSRLGVRVHEVRRGKNRVRLQDIDDHAARERLRTGK